MGGGNGYLNFHLAAQCGLSPRGRGKRCQIVFTNKNRGSIPAWAGETICIGNAASARRVYPRVGGGNGEAKGGAASERGLSPRGRGKHQEFVETSQGRRSIPAWAGETVARMPSVQPDEVYPRVGGGNRRRRRRRRSASGLSPRGRGKPRFFQRNHDTIRSIPAWAGETPGAMNVCAAAKVYPRVGGGNEQIGVQRHNSIGLSPRGRGKRAYGGDMGACQRSIPAWAGETARPQNISCLIEVYPRVGGGNSLCPSPTRRDAGLSPRGRGKPRRKVVWDYPRRSIPAWAGETKPYILSNPSIAVYPRVGGGNEDNLDQAGANIGLSPRGRGKPARLLLG